MFFEEHEKKIYVPSFLPSGTDKKYDPLAIDRALRKVSSNRISQLISAYNAPNEDTGDVSESGRLQTLYESDEAEETLASISRSVFGLPPFPDCTDAMALEYLFDYLEYMKKKETTDTIQRDSITSEATQMYNFGTPISLPSISGSTGQ